MKWISFSVFPALVLGSIVSISSAEDAAQQRKVELKSWLVEFHARKVPPSETKVFREIWKVIERGEASELRRLVRDIFAIAAEESRDDSEETVMLLLWRILLLSPDNAFVSLEHIYDPNPRLRAVAHETIFSVLHQPSKVRNTDFTPIVVALEDREGDEIRDNAYRYMFQRDPSAAFDVVVPQEVKFIQQWRELFIVKDEAELALARLRLVAKAKAKDPNEPALKKEAEKALGKLSQRKEWWCKLYVAETLSRNNDLFQIFESLAAFPELQDEKHPWVREALDNPFTEAIKKELVHYRTPAPR